MYRSKNEIIEKESSATDAHAAVAIAAVSRHGRWRRGGVRRVAHLDATCASTVGLWATPTAAKNGADPATPDTLTEYCTMNSAQQCDCDHGRAIEKQPTMDLLESRQDACVVHAAGTNAHKKGADDDGNDDDEGSHDSEGSARTRNASSGQSRAVRRRLQERGSELVRFLR
jgi:hypothetical protein